MADTPKLTLPLVDGAQTQKHVTHNEALELLDILVQLTVLDRDLTDPPGSPSAGDTYIVASGGTGDWDGEDGNIAYWDGAAWAFISPFEGLQAWIADEYTRVVHDGAAWASAVADHSHEIADVSGLQSELDGKADTGHDHDGSYAPLSRLISAAGLATGGGDLSADRTITVPKASQVEAEAGTDDAKGMTPLKVKQAIDALAGGVAASSYGTNGYVQFSDGLVLQWGDADDAESAVTFPIAFPTACHVVMAIRKGTSDLDKFVAIDSGSISTTSFEYSVFNEDGTDSFSEDVFWLAIGN